MWIQLGAGIKRYLENTTHRAYNPIHLERKCSSWMCFQDSRCTSRLSRSKEQKCRPTGKTNTLSSTCCTLLRTFESSPNAALSHITKYSIEINCILMSTHLNAHLALLSAHTQHLVHACWEHHEAHSLEITLKLYKPIRALSEIQTFIRFLQSIFLVHRFVTPY